MSNQIEGTIFGVCENNIDMIEVCGDYTNWYNENENSLEDCIILNFEGMTIESIDEESLILEIVEDDWYVEDLDSLGNIDYHLDAKKLKSILGEIDVEEEISDYEKLKEKYADKIVTDGELEEINETSGIYVENGGNSGRSYDETVFHVYEYDFDKEERIDEDEDFVIYG